MFTVLYNLKEGKKPVTIRYVLGPYPDCSTVPALVQESAQGKKAFKSPWPTSGSASTFALTAWLCFLST